MKSVMACGFAAVLLLAPRAWAATAGGRAEYVAHCAACHGVNLEGVGAPALSGKAFAAKWSAPADLRRQIERMPKGAPHSLSAAQYAAIAAYLGAANHMGAAPRVASGARPAAPVEILPAAAPAVARASTVAPSTEELAHPADGDWPMYNRDYAGSRYSPLKQIDADDARTLRPACILQVGELGSMMASPIFYRGVGYVTSGYTTVAFDGATCARKWVHTYAPSGPEGMRTNRGAAIADGRLFRGTSDGHLLALDLATGAVLWDAHVADAARGYTTGSAPIVYGGLVIIGTTGGDFGAPGEIVAFDSRDGRPVWTFHTVPTGREPGAETWKQGQAHGGGAVWTSFAIDARDGLVFAPVGNPGPDLDSAARPGENLYTNAVVALDARTGKLAWYAQQRPADFHDWDTAAPPMLYDLGSSRRLAQGSKDGFVYLYDRDTHALVEKTAVSAFRNVDLPLDKAGGVDVCPGPVGGVEWFGPASDPGHGAILVGSNDWCATFKLESGQRYAAGQPFFGGAFSLAPAESARGRLTSLDANTGKTLWTVSEPAPMIGGVTPTAGGVILTGCANGDFLVYDSRDGRELYRFHTGGAVAGGVSTYLVGDRQYVAVASGNRSAIPFGLLGAPIVVVFGLPEAR